MLELGGECCERCGGVGRPCLEIERQLLQKDPGDRVSGTLEAGYRAPVGQDAESVVRRCECCKYAGAFDPESREALVAVSGSHPEAFEIGACMGAQNAAINLDGNPIAAVPEPGSWAMMLAGLALRSARRWRRRARIR
jgi:hypothetical protein